MSGIQISIEAAEAERVQRLLAGIGGGAQKALYNAIGRTQAKVRTETTRSISGVYAITQQNLRAVTNIKSRIYGNGDEVVGEVIFAGTKLPLYRYGVTPKVPTFMQRKVPVNINGLWKTVNASAPVSAVIKRGGSNVRSDSAFIAQMESGHIGVFERIGINSSKIRERMGLATAQMAENSVVLENVEREAQETLNKRIEQEITRILNGF